MNIDELVESLLSEDRKAPNFALRNTGRVLGYLKDLYNSDDEEQREKRDNLKQLSDIHGVNFDFSDEEYKKRIQQSVNEKNEQLKNWVLTYLPTLRECWLGNTFKKSKEVAKYDDKSGGIRNTMTKYNNGFDNLSPEVQKNVINLGSFLDKNKLTCLYRDFQKQESVKYSCGIYLLDDSINKNTPIEYLRDHLDFSGLLASKFELLSTYDGTRVDSINREAGFNDKELHTGEEEWEKIAKIATVRLAERRAKLYVNSTYGVDLKFGDDGLFKYGNAKIDKDTLIVNFSSAVRCAAWNECIMKDACYAKTAEIQYDNTFYSNMKKGMIWEQTRVDETLMNMLMALLRSYLLNYSKLPFVRKVKDTKAKEELMWNLCQNSLFNIRDTYGDEAIAILEKTRLGNLVRLNENGDFIGQWLVDAFEEFARELELVGIHVTAYTCRALNYESVEKMILNISQQGLVSKQNSKGFAHFFYAIDPKDYARLGETYGGRNYSLDINPETHKITPVYRRLQDKDGLKGYYYKCPCGRGKYEYNECLDYSLVIADGVPYNESTNMFFGNTIINGSVVDARLIGNKIKGNFVYDRRSGKCYIKNGSSKTYRELSNKFDSYDDSAYEESQYDFGPELPSTIVESSPKIFLNVSDGKVYKKSRIPKDRNARGKVADCYMCRICYARDADGGIMYEGGKVEGVPVYVFVATHGANKSEFQGESGRLIAGRKAGEWASILGNETVDNTVDSEDYAYSTALRESIVGDVEDTPTSDKRAISAIVNNITSSVFDMMSGMSTKLNEIKGSFKDLLDRIKG